MKWNNIGTGLLIAYVIMLLLNRTILLILGIAITIYFLVTDWRKKK